MWCTRTPRSPRSASPRRRPRRSTVRKQRSRATTSAPLVVPSRSGSPRSEEHTSELQSRGHLVCRLLLDTALTALYHLSLHDALPIYTILGENAVMDYDVVPNVVYTHPEVAQVGFTEAQAKEKYGAETKVARYNFRASGRALALGESEIGRAHV